MIKNMLIFLTACLLAQPHTEKAVHFETLAPSGVRVILCERPAGETFAIAAGFRIGSAFDGAATSGYAHLIEHHLLFRGTELSDENALLARWRRLGGDFNGRTYPDYTLFTVRFNEQGLYAALELLREMLLHPVFPHDALARERKVLCAEMRARKNRPFQMLHNLTMQALYGDHNYSLPLGGDPLVIEAVSADALYARYDSEYTPGRLTLAIVGPIKDKEKLAAFLRETFGSYQAQTTMPPAGRPVPVPKRGTRKIATTTGRRAHVCFGFSGPPAMDKDWLPFVVMARALCGGERSVLQNRLIFQDGIATRVDLDIEPRAEGGYALCRIQLDPDVPQNLARCEREFRKILDGLGEWAMAGTDIDRAKNQIALSYGFKTESFEALAAQLVGWDILGKWQLPLTITEQLAKLPSETFQRIGSTYFSRDRCVMAAVVPDAWPASAYRQETSRLVKDRIRMTGDAPFPLVSISLPDTQKFSFALCVKGGLLHDRLNEEGLSALVARAILRGGKGETSETFQDRLLRYGVQTEAGTTRDYSYLRFSAPEGYFEDALQRIARAVIQPAFHPAELEEVRRKLVAEAEAFPSLMQVAERLLWARAFAKKKYGVFPPGRKSFFKNNTWNLPYKVNRYWETWWRPDNFTVSVCGPMKADQMAKIVLQAFSPLTKINRPVFNPAATLVAPAEKPGIIVSDWQDQGETGQTFLLHGWFSRESNVENLVAFLLIREILAGAPGTRLWKLRQSDGLLYHLTAKVVVTREVLCFELAMLLSVDDVNRVRMKIFNELHDLSTRVIAQDELDLAVKAVQRANSERNNLGATLVTQEAWYLFADWTTEEFSQCLSRMTPMDLQAVIRRYFEKNRVWTVGIGPESALSEKLTK